MKLKPGESHLSNLYIECINENFKIGINYMKPTKKYFRKKVISYNDLINDKELIKSFKLIWSK